MPEQNSSWPSSGRRHQAPPGGGDAPGGAGELGSIEAVVVVDGKLDAINVNDDVA